MLRSIRKNFFHVVVLCDATDPASRSILKLVESFYIHRAPTRIGLVFKVPTRNLGWSSRQNYQNWSPVRIRHLPQRSWCAAGSLCNNVDMSGQRGKPTHQAKQDFCWIPYFLFMRSEFFLLLFIHTLQSCLEPPLLWWSRNRPEPRAGSGFFLGGSGCIFLASKKGKHCVVT